MDRGCVPQSVNLKCLAHVLKVPCPVGTTWGDQKGGTTLPPGDDKLMMAKIYTQRASQR